MPNTVILVNIEEIKKKKNGYLKKVDIILHEYLINTLLDASFYAWTRQIGDIW